MFNFSKKKKYDLVAPVNGTMIKLEDLPDEMFAMMGQGVAFRYDDNEVCSPADGKIIMIANTLHAIGIEMKNGAQLLIHIGMDTVDLNGQGNGVNLTISCYLDAFIFSILFQHVLKYESGII